MKIVKNRMVIWSAFLVLAMTWYWSVWYLIVGHVPVVSSVKMNSEWTWNLPFVMSRWTDTLAAPLWGVLFANIYSFIIPQKDSRKTVLLTAYLLLSACLTGLSIAIGNGIIDTCQAALAGMLVTGIVLLLIRFDQNSIIRIWVVIWVGAMFGAGMVTSLWVGFVVFAIAGITMMYGGMVIGVVISFFMIAFKKKENP